VEIGKTPFVDNWNITFVILHKFVILMRSEGGTDLLFAGGRGERSPRDAAVKPW
jgi:hypothetical protein